MSTVYLLLLRLCLAGHERFKPTLELDIILKSEGIIIVKLTEYSN